MCCCTCHYIEQTEIQQIPFKVIIDGMDQDKMVTLPKAMAGYLEIYLSSIALVCNPAGGYKLETHITGVCVHGRGTTMFIDCSQFHHDSNLTVEILLQLFNYRCWYYIPFTFSTGGVATCPIYSTCRDNKNKYILTFVALLVERGIFRKVSYMYNQEDQSHTQHTILSVTTFQVKMGFLPVVHAHEDIDHSVLTIPGY